MQFLNLPSELISERILPFLKLKWIVRLDSAVAVKTKRQGWLDTVSRIHHFKKFSYEITKYKLHEIHWLCSRNIAVHRLDINIRTDTQVVQTLLDSQTFSASRVTRLDMLPINNLDGRIICRFLSLFTEIRELSVCTRNAELDKTILSVATKLSKLEIRMGGPVSPLLDQRHPHLEEFFVCNDLNMHADTVIECLQYSSKLRVLTTRGQGSDALLEALGAHCKYLQYLKLELSNHTPGHITDAGILALAAGCPDLRCVDFTKMNQLSETAFIALAEQCAKVTTFSVYMCSGITDRSMCAMGQHWPQLTELNVIDNMLVTDAAIVAIAKGCPLLTICKLAACKALTDTAVIALAGHCTHLTTLSVSYCPLITDDAIICVLQNCVSITDLCAPYCKLLTAACLAPLTQQPCLVKRLRMLLLPWNVGFASEGIVKIQRMYPFVSFE